MKFPLVLFLLGILNAINKNPTRQSTNQMNKRKQQGKKGKEKKNCVRISLDFMYFILKAEFPPTSWKE